MDYERVIGESVEHEEYGNGVIKKIIKSGSSYIIDVQFGKDGNIKRFGFPEVFIKQKKLKSQSGLVQTLLQEIIALEQEGQQKNKWAELYDQVSATEFDKPAFNVANLAAIGALGDFYDAYQACLSASSDIHDEVYKRRNDPTNMSAMEEWRSKGARAARKICEPLLNSYLYIFTDKHERIFANAYGFSFFTLFNTKKDKSTLIFVPYNVTFPQFLGELEYAVSRVLYRWAAEENSSCRLIPVYNVINKHVAQVAFEKQKERKIPIENREPPTNSILYLYDQLYSTSCYKNNHPVVPRTFIADLSDQSGQIVLPVHFCQLCKKFFIGKKTLELFEKSYGKMMVETQREGHNDDEFETIGEESKLHQLGYNVVEGDMTEYERHALLVHLIEGGSISYLEVCACIERNIRWFQNSYRHRYAVPKWKNDLEFIGQWVMSNPEYK